MNNDSIRSIIDRLRVSLKQTSSDSIYGDQFLYDILLDIRNQIIEQAFNKRQNLSRFNKKIICMPLELSKNIPCDCLPEHLGCEVLKSKYPIPAPVSSNYGDILSVLSVDGSRQYTMKEVVSGKYNKYSRLASVPAYATIYNNYLYIIGIPNNELDMVLIELIPKDPISLYSIPKYKANGSLVCDNEGNTITCYDERLDTFNIDGRFISTIIQMARSYILEGMQIPEDTTNNRSSERQPTTI